MPTLDEAIKIWQKDDANAPINIYFGSGYEHPEDYITVDLNPSCSDAYVIADCTQPFPGVPDNSVDEILTLHTIEHVGHRRLVPMLIEWRRMLKPGGRIVLETPNLAACLEKFCAIRHNSGEIKGDFGDGSVYETLYGGQKDLGSFHISCLTMWQLMCILKAAGFADDKIVREIPQKGKEYGFDWNLRVVAEK